MKRILVALMAAFVASAVFAKVPIQQGFESASGPSDAGFVPSVGAEDDSQVVTYASGKPSNSLAPYPFAGVDADASFGSKYLSIDTGDSTLWCANSTTGNVYFDMVAQFQPVTETSVALSDDAKFAVYLDSNSNVVVVAGNGVYPATVTNANVTATTLDPGTWARVTIAAENNAFSVRINGTLVSSSGTSSFPFLKSGDISSVGFTGTGALDDFVARTTDPYFDNTLMIATIGGTSGERYASLAAAVADAGEDDVIELQSNNSESITLAEGMIFKLKCATGVEYTGTVTSYSGYRLVVSEPDANGVVTYSQSPYKPSININFTSNAANGLTTGADVGLGDYAIPGTSWNNLAGSNGSLSALNAADSTGETFATAASVTITGTRGPYQCSNLTATSDLRHGYIDENGENPTPTVTVSGIPYEKYRVVVYAATDTGGASFGYITINGKNYTYVNDALTEGTTAWGNAGAQDSAEPIAEGTNVLVSAVTIGSTLTVVGHRGDNARGCIAAIQIVEYVPEITENDLVIRVVNDTTYTVSEAKTLSGTVYVVGSGTLTLDGSAKITAATIDVGPNVTMNVNADRLDATTYAGVGTVVYDGTVPANTKGWNNSAVWAGTLWIKNTAIVGLVPADVANVSSTVRLTGVTGYFNSNGNNTFSSDGTLDLQDDGNTKAFTVSNGWSLNGITVFAKLTGSGTLTQSNHDIFQRYVFRDVSAFTGTIDIPEGTGELGLSGNRPLRVIIGNSGTIPDTGKGTITIPSGSTTIAAGATWKAAGGIQVNGTLTVADNMTMPSALTVASGGTLNVNTGKKLALVNAYNLDGTVNVNGTLYSEDVNHTQTINGTVNVAGAFDAQGDVVIAPTGNITVSGKFWPNYGVRVKGNLSAPSLANIRSVSYVGNPEISVDEGGVFTLTSTSNNKVSVDTNNADYEFEDYSRVKGSGTLKFLSTAGWRTFPSDDARMPATTLTIQAELADSLIITKDNNGETVIGNLAGSKNIRSDWTATSGGANARTLTVTQSKDTEWQGKFVSNRITQFNVAGTGGTLTLSGTQTLADVGTPIPLNVSGSVNLTGTWVGPVTVAGTFGGTGTLSGNLTLSDSATLIVNDVSHPLAVTGAITATGTINVKLPAGTTSVSQNIISATGTVSSDATFNVYVGESLRSNMKVKPVTGGLKIVTTGSIISYF